MKFNTYNSINAPHTPGRFQGAATVNMTVNGAIRFYYGKDPKRINRE